MQGTIEFRGQVDWYSFDADADDNVFIELVEGEGMDYMILEIFDPRGERVGNANSSGGAVVSIIDTKLQTSGTHSMRIRNNGSDTGSYTLSLTKLPPSTILRLTPRLGGDACEASVRRCSMQGTIEFRGQVDWYSFDADADDNVFIELVEGEGMDYMILEIFDPRGERVGSANSSGGAVVSTIDTKLQTSGTHSMRIRNNGSDTGSYTLSLTTLPPSTILTPAPRLGADDCDTLVAGCSIQGTIESSGQVHRYSFDADAGDNIFIELVEGEGMDYMILEIFDPRGERVGSANSSGGAVVSIVDTKLQTGGTYSMRIRNNGSDTGSYTLSFHEFPS